MVDTMPAKPPFGNDATIRELRALGEQLRLRRKTLRLNAVTVAEAAGMSRVTLHRVERGEPAVTMGSYKNVVHALGLELGLLAIDTSRPAERETRGWLPVRIRLDEYPQLRRLAWQVGGVNEMTPSEALGVYERNWRHLDQDAIDPKEQDLIDALRVAFGKSSV